MEGKQRTLIIIDDETELNEMLVDMVNEMGYKTYSAKNGVEALEIILSCDVDAALCDISMPEMNGIELVMNLRAKGNNIPFIFLTGHSTGDYILKAVQLGVTEFLQKPFLQHNLTLSITRILDIGMRISRRQTMLQKLAETGPEARTLVDMILKDEQQIERLRASASIGE